MAKPFNKKLNEDITKLKLLHAKKDKTEFNKLKAEIMERHSISKATVYRELQKDVPGSYDRKRSDRPVTAKEIGMVRALLEQQYKIQDIIDVLERKTGMPYSWDRIDKIRLQIEDSRLHIKEEKPLVDSGQGSTINNEQLSISNEKQSMGTECEGDEQNKGLQVPLEKESSEARSHLGGLEIIDSSEEKNPPVSPLVRGTGSETLRQAQGEGNAFGDNLREFIDELMDADKIAEGDFINVHIGGAPYVLNRKIIRDITMIITNYAECYLASVQLKRPEPDEEEYIMCRDWFINDDEPLSPIDELVKKQEAVLRKFYGPGGFSDLERNPPEKSGEGPCDISELNRLRIFHLVADKIRNAVSGNFITLKELKELNEINRYFKEFGEY